MWLCFGSIDKVFMKRFKLFFLKSSDAYLGINKVGLYLFGSCILFFSHLSTANEAKLDEVAAVQHKKELLSIGVIEFTHPEPMVRKLFYKNKDSWQVSTEIPKLSFPISKNPDLPAVEWTMVFSGKDKGSIISKYPEKYKFYSERGLQKIESPISKIPQISEDAMTFSQNGGESKFHPLVAVTASNFLDPDGWKVATFQSMDEKRLIDRASKEYSNYRCFVRTPLKPRYEKIKRTNYKILKSYQSKEGVRIFTVTISCPSVLVGNDEPDEIAPSYTFVVDKNRLLKLEGLHLIATSRRGSALNLADEFKWSTSSN